jgi:hypothetical protein
MTITAEFSRQVEDLLAQAGFSGPVTITRLEGGANNRVYRVEVDGTALLLKAYFRHPADPRDRLATEFAFCRFAWEQGLEAAPRPIIAQPQAGLALYQWLEGRRLAPAELTAGHIQQALDFYTRLNRARCSPAAAALPVASEAYFTLSAHLQGIERRLQRLLNLIPLEAETVAAADFVQRELYPLWRQIYADTLTAADLLRLDPDEPLPEDERRLSPSDFGFHNALLTVDNRLCFVDFEYAGWDDPAKLVGDFFCQPAVPVPLTYFETVAQAVAADLPGPAEGHIRRFALLLPVYRIKWICMLLNDFLPVDNARRNFAHPSTPSAGRKAQQLQKAQLALEQITLQPIRTGR